MQKLKLYAQKIGDDFKFDRVKFNEFIGQISNGCYAIEIKRAVKSKSQEQLGAHFGLMIQEAIAKANDDGMDTSTFLKELVKDDIPSGVGLTKDFLKEIFYALCPIYDDEGRRVTLSKASTLQASKHFNDCRNLLAGHGIFIDEPNPRWKEKESAEKYDKH